MALYFECRMNKKLTPLDCFFGNFTQLGNLIPELLSSLESESESTGRFRCPTLVSSSEESDESFVV